MRGSILIGPGLGLHADLIPEVCLSDKWEANRRTPSGVYRHELTERPRLESRPKELQESHRPSRNQIPTASDLTRPGLSGSCLAHSPEGMVYL